MKCFLLVIVGLALLCNTTCLVTTRPKTVEVTTDILENDTEKIEIKEKKNNYTEKVNKDIYLEDVVFALQNQDWSKQEEACLNQTLQLIRNLRNFTLWAVWDWDSIASEPQGLLFGNRYQLGNFDECLNPPWVPSRPELKTQYCLADIVLERTDYAVKKRFIMGVDPDQSVLDYLEVHPPHSRPLNELTWGVCVPASCGSGSVERLMRTMLARSHIGVAGIRPRITTGDCQRQGEERPYDAAFWAFIAVLAVLIITSLVCTYLNNRRFKCEPTTLKDDIIEAFCLRENANNLLKMHKDGIEVFYGIRFLGLCGIVVVHQLGILNSGAVSNGKQVDQLSPGPGGWIVLHDDLFVDTFFLLSGFLTATAFSQMKRFPNPLLAILKRYIRLMPAFAIVIFFVSAVYPYTGSGPMWPKLVEGETGSCRKNWWLNLLMLNNYIDSEHICLVVSWYIPCDFHFSCAAICLYWLYTRQPRLGLVCAGAITVASVLLPGVLTYKYNWNPIQLFTFEFVSNPRGSPDFHHMYIKSHHRAASYIVGFFSGFIFIKNKNAMRISRVGTKWAILGSISGIVIMLSVLISGTTFLWRTYHPIEGAVYAAINRPLWTVGVAMLVLCCSLGYVPLIKAGLSWHVWVPLSRLSYGVYLTHTLICMRSVFVARNSQHYDFGDIFTAAAGVIFWGCIAAFFIWLIAEAPALRLFDIFVKRVLMKRTTERKAEEKSATQQTSTISTPGSSSGHLQDNLPTTVQFSSKV
ncbi:nose resistant to fluoxetine protein 6-like [Cydia amplana]|uniref:nose resistant to fluoxetine protein 6-like n=1 Tax=Cydia amplana TaxID=1869771 RepID=UPI002FE60FDE